MMKGVSCPMTKERFQLHMKEKAKQWEADTIHIGNDFAVLKFPYPYKCSQAIDNLKHYAEYYGYNYEKSDTSHLVIINRMEN